MPYRRPYGGARKRYPKRRYYRKNRSTAASTAWSLLKGVGLKMLKSKLGLNTETHWLDTVETNVALTTTAVEMAYPTLIVQADDINARNGAKVRLTQYECKIQVNAGVSQALGTTCRFMFVKWKNTRGTTPSSSACLDSATRITSPLNMGDAVSSIGFTVLYDKTFYLAPYGQDGDKKTLHFNWKPLSHMLEWTATNTTGVAASLQDGYVIGYCYCDNVTVAATYTANHRVKFVDN